jgi:chorismate synthase
VQWDRKLDGRLAQALMSIQAIKGVEIGDGFETTRRRGSQAHDELVVEDGLIEVPHALRSIDVTTGEAAPAHHQRSDVSAVPAAGVVAEAMVALVVADAVLEKFGGDSLAETKRNLEAYVAAIPATLRTTGASAEA